MACKKLKTMVINKIINFLDNNKSFVLEAGAGSGKTYTLIQTINHLIETKGTELKFKNKSIICITYTNVAKNEILERLENNPLVLVSTVHEFLWANIKNYQKQLLIELDVLNSNMQVAKPDKFELGLYERIKEKEVLYNDSSYRDFENGQIHHDDVISLAKSMFKNYNRLTSIIAEKFPYILIDEYQDTAPETISAFLDDLLKKNIGNIVLGFYGDSYQKIYDSGVGSLQKYVDDKIIELITKEENYRSSKEVVNLLNEIRDNLTQQIPDGIIVPKGSVNFINCDSYPTRGVKEKITDYEKMLIPIKNSNYDDLIKKLELQGWDFSSASNDKILIIANSRVAERGGFGRLYKVYSNRFGEGANEALMKRENIFTKFFLGSLDKKTSKERKSGIEHLMSFWNEKKYNEVMYFLNKYSQSKFRNEDDNYFYLKKHDDKIKIHDKLKELDYIRQNKTVKDVFDFILLNKLLLLPEGISKYLKRINSSIDDFIEVKEKERLQKDIQFFDNLMELKYSEFIQLFKHTQNETVFSTKHGTKGEEYRNVLVVIDDTSWKQQYNFENYFNDTEEKADRKLRTKNLFYVSCSRAKENLVVLALSEMKKETMDVIKSWFKEDNTYSINQYINS